MTTAVNKTLACIIVSCIIVGNARSQRDLCAQDLRVTRAAALAVGTSGDARLPVPSQAKVEESIALIRDAYEVDYKAAKESGEPEQLIAQLSQLARQETDQIRSYALFTEAENVAARYENYRKAIELLEARAERFRVDGLVVKGELLKRLAGPNVSADLDLCSQAMEIAEQARKSERFEVASAAAALAVSIATVIEREQKAAVRKQRQSEGTNVVVPTPIGPDLVKKTIALQSQVTATEKLFQEYSDTLEKMTTSPDSSSTNAVVGRYLCFVRQDWKHGLPVLAKSGLPELSAIATDETKLVAAGPIDAQQAFELAGRWWSAAEADGSAAEYESVIKDHAARLYADAADALTGALEKRLATSRLRGLAKRETTAGKPSVRLSDLPIKRSLVGWDRLRVGKLPDVSVNDKVPSTAIYAHASSLVVCVLPENFDGMLRGGVGIAGLSSKSIAPSSCRFRILGDDTLLWESGVINQDKKSGYSVVEQFDVKVAGCRAVSLEVDSLGANHSDWSVWLDPVLHWKDGEKSSVIQQSLSEFSPPTRPEKVPADAVRFNGKWLWFSDQQVTPVEANIKANELGGVVAVISNNVENEFFITKMRGPLLLGIERFGERWITQDGKPQEFFNWGRNQPDMKPGVRQNTYVIESNGRWHDKPSTGRYYFAVQWQ